MKPHFASMAATAALAASALADTTTGWIQTAAGTYDFLDPANWADGNVNGVFGTDLTLNQNINVWLSDDWTGSFKFLSAATYATFSIFAKDASRTVFLDDDIELACSGGEVKTRFILGDVSAAAAQTPLVFDLGGRERKVSVSGAAKWTAVPSLAARFANGKLVLDTNNAANRKICFAGIGGSDGDVALAPGTILQIGHASDTTVDLAGEKSVSRARDLALSRAEVDAGHKVNAEDSLAGSLKIDNGSYGASILQAKPQNTGKTYSLVAQALDVAPGATLVVRGSTLGRTPAANVANVKFRTAPALVGGGGGDGTPQVSIVPQLIGATTDAGGVGECYDQTFVTYDMENGLRPLAASEFSDDPDAGLVNLKIASGSTVELSGPTTVNSLFYATAAKTETVGVLKAADGVDDATLTVASGMILYGYANTGAALALPVSFGSRHGVFAFGSGKVSRFNGSLHGSGGVTFTSPIAVTAAVGSGGMNVSGDAGSSTYTGDTYIQERVTVETPDFLPHGDRTGDVYVNGILLVDNFAINGLNGSGTLNRRSSGTKRMSLGDNDADGDFTGTLSVTDNGSTLAKIGTGTQRFAGTVSLASNGSLNVNAGAVVIDGTVAQGAVNVAAGAAIGGGGEIRTSLAFADGAKLAVDVEDGVAKCLDVAGAVTGGTVTVDASVSGSKWTEPQCVLRSASAITASFAKGADVGKFELRNCDTELWVEPVADKATVMVFR